MPTPDRINKFLFDKNHDLAVLITRARELDVYTAILHTLLDPILASHCRVANIHEHNLVVSVDSAIWATKLRFVSEQVLSGLRKRRPELASLKAIKARVYPLAARKTTAPTSAEISRLSLGNAELIKTLARNLDNAELRAALLRLSRHTLKR